MAICIEFGKRPSDNLPGAAEFFIPTQQFVVGTVLRSRGLSLLVYEADTTEKVAQNHPILQEETKLVLLE